MQSAADSKVTSPVGGMVAVGSALSALPLVIVSASPLLHLSSSSLPGVNIPQTINTKQLHDTVTLQSHKDSFTSAAWQSAVVSDLPERTGRHVAGTQATKSVPRLSRENAVDLSVTSVTDSDVILPPTTTASPASVHSLPAFITGPQIINVTLGTADTDLMESCDERVIPRREIAPIPGAICSVEEAARVGSSYLCSFCGKTFSSAAQLSVHRNIHFFERQFKCVVCRSFFASRADLEQHRRKEHRGENGAVVSNDPRPYKCDECGVAFRIPGHLAKHKRSKVHAARLENSQDLPGTAESPGALPLTIDERDTVETETDVSQTEASCREIDCAAENEREESDSGELCQLSFS